MNTFDLMLTGNCYHDSVQKHHGGKAYTFRSRDGQKTVSLPAKILEMMKKNVSQR